MYGLEPTHREELRAKQGLRFFLEEMALDSVFLLKAFATFLVYLYFCTKNVAKFCKKFILNERNAYLTLLAIAVAVAMLW
jgi:hypothetical protein